MATKANVHVRNVPTCLLVSFSENNCYMCTVLLQKEKVQKPVLIHGSGA